MKLDGEIIIAVIGLFSLASLFVGTALALVFVGFMFAFKVAIASILLLAFALFCSQFDKY